MKNAPHVTRTGIQIGCRYTPPAQRPTPEENLIQSVLLGTKKTLNEDEFTSIRFHVILFAVVAIVVALDVFLWRP